MDRGGGGGRDPVSQLGLPPGFRFFPTDEELLVHYLCRKISGQHFSLPIIGDIDLYKFEPWLLPGKAVFGEKEWYFFSPRDRKYPNGTRPNRVAGSGYWKATGTDKVIVVGGKRVGIKKALVFYVGKAPKGSKTNWIMHEYRICDTTASNNKKIGSTSLRLDDWVLCRIYRKSSGAQQQKPFTLDAPYSNCNSSSSNLVHSLHSSVVNNSSVDANHHLTNPIRHCFGSGSIPAVCRMNSPSDMLGSSSIEEEVDSALLHSAHVYHQQRQEEDQGDAAPPVENHNHSALFTRLLRSFADGSLGYPQ